MKDLYTCNYTGDYATNWDLLPFPPSKRLTEGLKETSKTAQSVLYYKYFPEILKMI